MIYIRPGYITLNCRNATVARDYKKGGGGDIMMHSGDGGRLHREPESQEAAFCHQAAQICP
jgi:hypothetical protein